MTEVTDLRTSNLMNLKKLFYLMTAFICISLLGYYIFADNTPIMAAENMENQINSPKETLKLQEASGATFDDSFDNRVLYIAYWNNRKIEFLTKSYEKNGTLMVHFIDMVNTLEMSGSAIASTKKITLQKSGNTIEMKESELLYTYNGKQGTLSAAPERISGRTFLPIKDITNAFGISITIDKSAKTIIVSD